MKTVDDATACEACDLLWRHRQQGGRLGELPEGLRPLTRSEGYAIQSHLERRSVHPLWGWKIAATSAAGQRHIGVDGPLAGRLLREMVMPVEAPISLGANAMRVAEPEFVFRMGNDLLPRETPYTEAEVMAAVAALHLGIEVPDSRFSDFVTAGGPQLIADNACAYLFVLGQEVVVNWRDLNLAAHRVACSVVGRFEREGVGANVLGGPLIGLTWLANELSRHGVILRAGQYVTTGTCAVPLEIQPGDTVVADYGLLGRIAARFVA
jgi:2-keto-4-pentenoate hydratase